MCGIVHVRSRTNKLAVKHIRKQYYAQKHRGQNGYGYVEIDAKKVGPIIRTQWETEIMKSLSNSNAKEILFHHRIPTSTPNVPSSNHPIPVSHKSLAYDYIGVHNGGIGNRKDLEKKFMEQGFKYTTRVDYTITGTDGVCYGSTTPCEYNDSESLMIDLATSIEDNATKIKSEGGIAFIILQIDKVTRKPIKLFFGRNDRNPLKLEMNNSFIKLSSEGGGSEVESHTLHWLDYKTGEFGSRAMDIGWKYTPPKPVTTYSSHTHGSNVSSFNKKDEIPKTALNLPMKQEITKKEMGFDTSKKNCVKEGCVNCEKDFLPAHDPDNENSESFDEELARMEAEYSNGRKPIPGYEETGLPVKTSDGTKLFLDIKQLENAYVDVCEELDYWQKVLKNRSSSAERRGDAELMIQIRTRDKDIYETTAKELLPELWNEPTTAKQEPII